MFIGLLLYHHLLRCRLYFYHMNESGSHYWSLKKTSKAIALNDNRIAMESSLQAHTSTRFRELCGRASRFGNSTATRLHNSLCRRLQSRSATKCLSIHTACRLAYRSIGSMTNCARSRLVCCSLIDVSASRGAIVRAQFDATLRDSVSVCCIATSGNVARRIRARRYKSIE